MTDQRELPTMTTFNQYMHTAPPSTAAVTFVASSSDSLALTSAASVMDVEDATTTQKEREHQKRKRHSSSSDYPTSTDSSFVTDFLPTQTKYESTSNSTKQPDKKKSKRSSDDHHANMTSDYQQAIASSSARNAYPRGWSQLNIDFIESITPFVPPREISYLHRVCHAWIHIANYIRTPHLRFPPLCLPPDKVTLFKEGVIINLVHSLIRRHVSELVLSQPVTSTESALLALHLPKLQKLTCFLSCAKDSSWIFPSHLKKLDVRFKVESSLVSPDTISDSYNKSLVGLGHLTSLNFLVLSMPYMSQAFMQDQILSSIILQPLTQLVHSLTHLILDIPLTRERILVLRQLVNLISLQTECLASQELSELLAEPVPWFRLDEFHTWYEYSNEDVPLLKRLTHLTNFEMKKNAKMTDLSFLSHMTRLRHIRLPVAHPENLSKSLHSNPCQHLTSLILIESEIHDLDLSSIFSYTMPQLKTLGLIKLRYITSLAFMTRLSATLEIFRLIQCRSIDSKELLHLRFFPHLWLINLTATFPPAHPLDSFTLAVIDPNSEFFAREWFPALKSFRV